MARRQDDYLVRYDGHLIGRIRLGDQRYEPRDVGVEYRHSDGDAGLGEGSAEKPRWLQKDFHRGLGRLLKETDPVRLERAWELDRALRRVTKGGG